MTTKVDKMKEAGDESICSRLARRVISIEMFTFVVLMMLNNTGMFWYVISGIITSVERRYHFDSQTMGRLLMAPELAPLLGLLAISHFSNRFNMPRIIGALCIVYCIAMVLFTLPEYILSFDDTHALRGNTNMTLLCIMNSSSDSATGKAVETNTKAFGIMFGALLLVGIAAYPVYTLPYSYLERNTKKSRTSLYVALINMGWSTAPFLGLLLSAWCTSLYVDLKETSLKPEDPAWIGAWWLAIVIVAGLGVSTAPFLFCFPQSLNATHTDYEIATDPSPETESIALNTHSNDCEEVKADVYSWKGLLLSLMRLLKNPVYVMTIVAYIFWAQSGWGFAGFFPKFYQEIYSMTAWRASISAGIVTGIGQTVGRVVTSVVVSCLKISLRKSFILIMVFTGLSFLLLLASFFVGCDNVNLVGAPEDGGEFIINQVCAAGCDCSGIPYTPVCDAGLTYFSPCHAGCVDRNSTTELGQTIYVGCSCTETTTAIGDECAKECNMFIPYTIIVFMVFCFMSFVNPLIIVFIMRCVQPADQTLAYGLCMFTIGLLGWLPAPQIYGAVIDTTCAVWEDQGGGVRGSCWLYDIVDFRQKFQGLTGGLRLIQFAIYCVVYLLGRNKFESWEKLYSDEVKAPTKEDEEDAKPSGLKTYLHD